MTCLPQNYETHCNVHHQLDCRIVCVWCRRKTWNHGEKNKNIPHLLECSGRHIPLYQLPPLLSLTDFEDSDSESYSPSPTLDDSIRGSAASPSLHRVPSLPNPADDSDSRTDSTTESSDDSSSTEFLGNSSTEHRLFPTTHACFPRHLYDGHEKLPAREPERLWPLEETLSCRIPVAYRDPDLNLAACCCQFYLLTQDDRDWIHVTVPAVAFDSLREALDGEEGAIRTLPFSCWCDGGPTSAEPLLRQHRHLILVASRGRFDEFWSKVEEPSSKRFDRIMSCAHLVDVILYVSDRMGQCPFRKHLSSSPGFDAFYLFRTLPRESLLFLGLFWEGGLAEFLNRQKFRRLSLRKVAARPMMFDHGQWKQKMKDFYRYEGGLVLPVAKQYVACKKPTSFFFHLLHGKKLYFTCSEDHELLSEERWLSKQVAGGNVFYDNIGEELWTPRRRQRNFLKYYKPLYIENFSLKKKVNDLTEENNNLKKQLDNLIQKVNREQSVELS